MKKLFLILYLLWPSITLAANETTMNWGLSPGTNPRNLCVFDLSHTCVTTGSLDSSAHTFSPVGGGGGGTGTVTSVGTGTGLTGGPITNAGTISISPSGVTANTYGDAADIPVVTFDAAGRATSATTAVSNPAQVSGVAYPASPSTNTVPVVSAPNTITYEILPLASGGTGQITAPLARASTGLNIDEITTHGDSNYVIQPGDRTVGVSAALTSPRAWTLPAANAVNAGQSLCIVDNAGGIGATNTLTVTRAGADTINGSTTDVLNAQYAGVCLYSDGVSKWTFIPQATGVGSGTVTSVGSGAGLTGGTITVSGSLAVTGAAGQILAGATPALTSTPTLGVAGSASGSLGLANGAGGGDVVTIQNTGATAPYNFVLPTSAGTTGQALLSAGGASPMTFGAVVVAGGGTGLGTITAHGVMLGEGTSNVATVAPGSNAGLFLQTQGASADPTYADAVTRVVVQTFTSSVTYTPTAHMLYDVMYCVGGGGGGGGIVNGSAGTRGTSGAGGGGDTSVVIASAATVGASQAITIPAAAAGGTTGGTSGAAGGDVSVGALCIGKGATGGTGGAGSGGGAGGVAGTGTFSIPGHQGGGGVSSGINTIDIIAGSGGDAGLGFGMGGQGTASAGTGAAGSNYGGGGAAAQTRNAGGASAGGAGAKGFVVIYEYVAR